MIFLWILGALLLLLLFLLFVGIKIRVSYKEEVTLSVSVLGIRIPLLPKPKKKINLRQFTRKRNAERLEKERLSAIKKQQRKQEKEKKKKAAKSAKKNEKKKRLPTEQTPVKDEPSMISLLLSLVGGIVDKFAGMLRVDAARIRITVGGPDAAKIALTYGIVSQGVAYLMEILMHKTRFYRPKNEYVSVVPNFLAETTTADISLIFTVRLWHFVNIGCTFLYRFIKEKIRRASVQA